MENCGQEKTRSRLVFLYVCRSSFIMWSWQGGSCGYLAAVYSHCYAVSWITIDLSGWKVGSWGSTSICVTLLPCSSSVSAMYVSLTWQKKYIKNQQLCHCISLLSHKTVCRQGHCSALFIFHSCVLGLSIRSDQCLLKTINLCFECPSSGNRNTHNCHKLSIVLLAV